MPSISDLLSQHELMLSLCSNLSSADIVHLAATSKDHWTYIAASDNIRAVLMGAAVCDGTGLVAQKHVFGIDYNNPEWKCLGKDAKECSGCGAKVCNRCRFHFDYDDYLFDSDITAMEEESHWTVNDHDSATFHGVKYATRDEYMPSEIQIRKALGIAARSCSYTCRGCHPLIDPERRDANEYWCHCHMNLYNLFVGNRWLCIPCFLKEETTSITEESRMRSWTHENFKSMPRHVYNAHRDNETCKCGAEPWGDRAICTICGWMRSCYNDEGTRLELERLLLAQLG